jgi:hypothetical protein
MGFVLTTLYLPFGFHTSIETGLAMKANWCTEFKQAQYSNETELLKNSLSYSVSNKAILIWCSAVHCKKSQSTNKISFCTIC